MQVVLKEAVHGGALGLLAPGTVDVPDSLAFELVATKRATWPGSRPNAWPDPSGVSGGGKGRLARPSGIVQATMFGGATAGKTWSAAFSAWGPFHAARLIFQNPTGSAVTIDNTCMAPTANAVMLGVNMVQPSGGSAAFTSPSGALTLSNLGTSAAPAINFGPRTVVRSIARSDGSAFPVLLARAYSVAAPNYHGGASMNALLDGTFAAGAGGHIFGTAGQSGDSVTTPSSWTSGGVDASGPAQIITGVEFEYDQRMKTIMQLGDSLGAGETVANKPQLSAGFLATLYLSQAGYKVAHQAGGVGGQTMQQIDTRGRAAIAALLPDVVILPSWTTNSASATQADWDIQWALFSGLAEYALSLGCIPVLLTPWPKSGLSGTQIAARATQRARVIASGLIYADIEAAVTATDGSGNWISGYSSDGTHPSTTAPYALIAQVLQASIAPLVG